MHVLVLLGLRFQTILVFKLLYAQPPVTDEQETKKQYGGTAVELQTGPPVPGLCHHRCMLVVGTEPVDETESPSRGGLHVGW